MVADSSHLAPTLTPLSPADEALFQRFIESGASLPALAESLKDRPLPTRVPHLTSSSVPPSDSPFPTPDSPPSSAPTLPSLYLWSTQPHIAAWIDFHERQLLLADQREMRAYLKDVAKTSPNPIERRRAATTIFRAPLPQGGTPLRDVRKSSLLIPQSNPSPITSRNTANSNNPPSTPPPHTPEHHPSPLATPSPDISDIAAANLFLTIINTPRRPASIATLRAFCMPSAKFDGVPIPTDPASFNARALDILTTRPISRPMVIRPSPDSSPSIARFLFTCGDVTNFSLELRRDSGAWLISRLEAGRFPEDKPP